MIHYSIRKVGTVTGLLHLVGLVKQKASSNKSENHATTELQQPGECLPIFDPLCNRICSLYYDDT